MKDIERTRCRRFGWSALLCWAVFGLGLEAMHGFKFSAYLDNALTRELLTLAHAHGIGLSLVVLVFGEAGIPLFGENECRSPSRALRFGALLIPTAFALSAIDHPEGDPNVLVWLVPIGALAILFALARTAYRAMKSV
jgi:hypothetical protein